MFRRPSPFALVLSWLGRHKRGFQPAGSDGWLCKGTQWPVQACHQPRSRPSKERTQAKSDLREADLIKVTAKGGTACGLHSLQRDSDKTLKYSSRRKSQETYVTTMFKGGGEKEKAIEMCLINKHRHTKSSWSSHTPTSKCNDYRKHIMSMFWHVFHVKTKKYTRWIMRYPDWNDPGLLNPASKQSFHQW